MAERLTRDEAMEIFKKYDEKLYEYYCKNAYFFDFNAINYAEYLKEKYELKQERKYSDCNSLKRAKNILKVQKNIILLSL